MLRQIVNWFRALFDNSELSDWYTVRWDDVYIYREASPPGKDSWSDQLRWEEIERICFEANQPSLSDALYFFTRTRPESYVIPLEARGGWALWDEVLERGLFEDELAIEAALSLGGLYCWPPETK